MAEFKPNGLARGAETIREAAFAKGPVHFESYFGGREVHAKRDHLLQLHRSEGAGPVLAIDPGRGYFQDQFPDAVALDYSLSALRRFLAASHDRGCGSAETFPFRSPGFTWVFTVGGATLWVAERRFRRVLGYRETPLILTLLTKNFEREVPAA